MAIVGEAHVVIRAIGDKLQGDIQKALGNAAKGAKASGNDTGENFSDGVNQSVKKNIDNNAITQPLAQAGTKAGQAAGDNASRELVRTFRRRTPELDGVGGDMGNRLGRAMGDGFERSRVNRRIGASLLKIGIFVPVISVVIGGISALTSGLFAMTAVMGSATQASVSLAGALGALVQGGVVAAIAFQGVGDAISKGLDPTSAQQFKEAMEKLPPPARAFVKEIIGMKGGFKELQRTAGRELFPRLVQGLEQLKPLFPVIKEGFKETGAAVGDAFKSITSAISSQTAINSIGNIMRTNAGFIRSFGEGVGGLTKGFIALLDAAQPLTLGLGRAFASWGEHVGNTLQAKNATGELTVILREANNAFQIIWRSTKNVAEGLFDLGKIAKPAGLDLFRAFERATAGLANFTDSQKNADRATKFFDNIKTNTLAIGGLLKELGKAFLRIGENPGIAKTADAIKAIVPDLERMINAGIAVGPAIAELAGEIAKLIASLMEAGAIDAVIDILTAVAEVLNVIVNLPFADTAIQILAIVAALGALARIARFGGKQFGKGLDAMGLAAIRNRGRVDSLADRFGSFGDRIGPVRNLITSAGVSIAATAAQMQAAVVRSRGYAIAQDVVARASTLAAAGVDKIRHPLRTLDRIFPEVRKNIVSFGVSTGAVLGRLGIGMPTLDRMRQGLTRLSTPIKNIGRDFATTARGMASDVAGPISAGVRAIGNGVSAVGRSVATVGRTVTTALAPLGSAINRGATAAFNGLATAATRTSGAIRTAAGATSRFVGAHKFASGAVGLTAIQMSGLDRKIGLVNTSMLAMAGFMVGGAVGAGIGAFTGFVIDASQQTFDFSKSLNTLKTALKGTDFTTLSSAFQGASADMKTLQNDMNISGVVDIFRDGFRFITAGFHDIANFDMPGTIWTENAKKVKEFEKAVGLAEGALQRLSNSNISLTGAINADALKTQVKEFLGYMKELGKPVSFKIGAPGAGQALSILSNFQTTLAGIKDKGSLAFKSTTASLDRFLSKANLSKQGIDLVRDAILGVKPAFDSIPPGKEIKLTANDIALLDSLGYDKTQLEQFEQDYYATTRLEDMISGDLGPIGDNLAGLTADPWTAYLLGNNSQLLGAAGGARGMLGQIAGPGADWTADINGQTTPGFNSAVSGATGQLNTIDTSNPTALIGALLSGNFNGVVGNVLAQTGRIDTTNALAGVGATLLPGTPGVFGSVQRPATAIDSLTALATVGAVPGPLAAFGTVLGGVANVARARGDAKVGAVPVGNPLALIASIIASLAFTNKSYTANVKANVSGFEKIAFAQAAIRTIRGKEVPVRINLTGSTAVRISAIGDAIRKLRGKEVAARVKLSGAAASKINGVSDAIRKMRGKDVNATVNLRGASAGKIKGVADAIKQLKPKTVAATANLKGASAGAISKVAGAIKSASSKTVTLTTHIHTHKHATAATGGLILGPGTSTSDSIPAMLSNGEFVVRAAMVKRHLSLLRAINAGVAIPKDVTPVLAASVTGGDLQTTSAAPAGQPVMAMTGVLDIRNGQAYVTGYAQQVMESNIDYNNSLKRMGN